MSIFNNKRETILSRLIDNPDDPKCKTLRTALRSYFEEDPEGSQWLGEARRDRPREIQPPVLRRRHRKIFILSKNGSYTLILALLIVMNIIAYHIRGNQAHQRFLTFSARGQEVSNVRVVVQKKLLGVTGADGTLKTMKTAGVCQCFDDKTNEPFEIQIIVDGKTQWSNSMNIDEDRTTIPLIVRRSPISSTEKTPTEQ